ncbi:hypothetical protein LOTGIDRAFT_231891 [Lottia gigantea]|uniref:NR LBD domain-containing protein n=1 Tax=Lottia gigantea TaxID=225164 RepID=V4APU3_LOTGI|nr:hypothetical protein LOTGIDRAFT_231891 [Lottia gigantea]ESO95656.1 hypothetical protein LOTGIDRAFT_231891 [Lottia gigantea]
MSEIQVILQSNGAFKSDLMEEFLCNKMNESTMMSSVDSQGNLMASPSTFAPATGSHIADNQRMIDNQTRQLVDNGQYDNQSNVTTTTTSDNKNRNGNGNQQAACVQDPNANTDADPELLEVQKPVSAVRAKLITEASEAIVAAHMGTTINTYENIAEAEKKIDENMASGNMPDMSKMAQNSGAVWQKFVAQMVPEITKAVKFINRLPGFQAIPKEDQMNLIKQGSFEVLLTRFCMLINVETGDMIDPSLKVKFPRKALSSMPMGQLLLEFYKVAEKFNPLNLTDGENGLFSSILVMCPEREGLQKKSDVEKIQNLFKQTLYLKLKENHSDADSIFTKLMSTIPVFAEINAKHTAALAKMKQAAPSEFDQTFQPLHKEMFNNN